MCTCSAHNKRTNTPSGWVSTFYSHSKMLSVQTWVHRTSQFCPYGWYESGFVNLAEPFSHPYLHYISHHTIFFIQIKLRWALFVTYTIIQSIMRSEMCSLHLTHPSAHTPGAVGSRHCGARGKSLQSCFSVQGISLMLKYRSSFKQVFEGNTFLLDIKQVVDTRIASWK